MGRSLQEQLIQAGLAKPKEKKRASRPKRSQRKSGSDISLARAYAIRADRERREHEQELAEKKAAARRRRERKAKLKALMDAHGVLPADGESVRNFTFRERIRRIYVNEAQRRAINSGELWIVSFDGRFHLLPAANGPAFAELAPEWVAFRAEGDAGSETEDERFRVPDDLVW